MPEHDNTAPSPATMTTLDKQETNERLVGDYVLLSKIGQGSFATVYKAQHKASLRPSLITTIAETCFNAYALSS